MSDIYVVLVVCLIIWAGVFSYLFYLDRQLKKLQLQLDFLQEEEKEKS